MEDPLQFDQVQKAEHSAICSSCQKPLEDAYFQANGRLFCAPCAAAIRQHLLTTKGASGRLAKATLFGLGAGLAGAAVYTAVLALTHINAALVTILIGWMVGKAMRKGADGRGGLAYQIIAALITYAMIGLSLVGSELLTPGERVDGLLSTVLIIAYGCAVGPIMSATHSIFGGLITAFGLFQAWKLTAPVQVNITGPHALARVVAPPSLPGAPPAIPDTLPPATSPEIPPAPPSA